MEEERETPELDAWNLVLEDHGYRSDSPDAWHSTLIAAADQLLSDGVIDWDDCLVLKDRANAGYKHALNDAVAEKLDDPDE